VRRAFLLCLVLALRAQQDRLEEGERLAAGRRFAESALVFQKALEQGTAAGDRLAMARALLGLAR
jgi:hypothetical protein